MFRLVGNPTGCDRSARPASSATDDRALGGFAAAALTTLVAAAVGAALAVFAGQALPEAVRHDLSVAAGTSLTAKQVNSSQIRSVTSTLR